MAKKTKNNKDEREKKETKNNILTFKISNKTLIRLAIAFVLIIILVFATVNFISINKKAKIGDTVEVLYVGRLSEGTVFDTNIKDVAEENNLSKTSYPLLKFTIGKKMVIPGFENGVIGMKAGQNKTISIKPEDAYGLYDANLVVSMPLEEFESKYMSVDKLKEGMELIYSTPDGHRGTVIISDIGTNYVRMDFNHKLAGKSLIFETKLVSINPK